MTHNLRIIGLLTAPILLIGASRLDASRSSSATSRYNPCITSSTEQKGSLAIEGIGNPATVSGAISVTTTGVLEGQSLVYCLDGNAIWTSQDRLYGLGSINKDGVHVFSVRNLTPGTHTLQAIAVAKDNRITQSTKVRLNVIDTADSLLSHDLKPYPLQQSLQDPISLVLSKLSTPDANLTSEEEKVRFQVAAMYRNFGFDLSADNEEDLSELLPKLQPTDWAAPSNDVRLPLSMRFSSDSPFYQRIPKNWPRVPLPGNLIKTVQLNTNQQGDGIGYGQSISEAGASPISIHSMWYTQESTRKDISFHISRNWPKAIPSLFAGDRHVIFIDPSKMDFVSAYKVSVDPVTGDPHALYAGPPTSFNSLGDRGGSTAARFSEIPLLIQPGEATSDTQEIHHAIGGPISRVWAARVYPATARDYGVLTNENTCTHKGKMNTGLVPYGGIIQLDPSLNLDQLHLSRPALRILRAMQTYGYYVMDFGCADLDIYTAVAEQEFSRFGGLYGDGSSAGVQKEISDVITKSQLFVVPPVTKRP